MAVKRRLSTHSSESVRTVRASTVDRRSPIFEMISTLYRTVLRRTSTFMLAAVGGAFVFERTFDSMADKLYENINRGKLWNDIKHKYEQ